MTVVIVDAGACGFRAQITATGENRRKVRVDIESDCESVSKLNSRLKELGPFGIRDVLSKGANGNPILLTGMGTLSHAGCPVLAAIIKACEVEMGLNVPCPVTIEFHNLPEHDA